MAFDPYIDETGEWVFPDEEDPMGPEPAGPQRPGGYGDAGGPDGRAGMGYHLVGYGQQGPGAFGQRDGWVPIFQGTDGRYYMKAGADTWTDWGGDPASLNPDPWAVSPATAPTAPTGGYPSGGGAPAGPTGALPGGFDPSSPAFEWPEFRPPTYDPGSPFEAPTFADAQNEPGYAFAMDQGRKALENSAAAKGILRTGGTLKDLFAWGNQFAGQNYANVFDRAARTWNMNDQQRRNTYENTYRGARDAFDYKYRSAGSTFDDMYRRWRDILDANTRLATAVPYD